MVGPRRRAREIALQILYLLDVNPELGPDDALELYFAHLHGAAGADGDVDGDDLDGAFVDQRFARELTESIVRGVAARLREIDERLAGLSKNWRIERMAQVDRSVMRLALFELTSGGDVPARVTLNEAVELAKCYGSAEAGAFVNGLLDRAAQELGIRV